VHEYKERLGACKTCGNSPVNHRVAYYVATFAIAQARVSRAARHVPLLTAFESFVRRVMLRVDSLVYRLFALLGFVTFNTIPEKAVSYRSQVVWEEAGRRGITMEQVCFLGRHTEMYRARLRGRWIYFESLPIPEEATQHAYGWLDDKVMLNEFLRENGIPLPPARSVRNEEDALRAFKEWGGLLVVKPRVGSRGRHTTTQIRDAVQVRAALKSARMLCRYAYISRHLEGSVCRGTVVEGKLAGFFQADPPRVTGDGISTIQELITKQNASKPERVENIVLTDEHHAFIGRMGYSEVSVIEAGKVIDLTHRTGRLFGGATRELFSSVHPRLKSYLEQAAKALAVPIVGFDIIIKDPEADPDVQEWGIIEANSLPFIDLHYLPLHGEPSNVAAQVWDLWETKNPA
jgi:cyanophycin synthetase